MVIKGIYTLMPGSSKPATKADRISMVYRLRLLYQYPKRFDSATGNRQLLL